MIASLPYCQASNHKFSSPSSQRINAMQPTEIRSLTVCLDQSAPLQGAFVHAIEWAKRLNLPVRAISFPHEAYTTGQDYHTGNGKLHTRRITEESHSPDIMISCSESCRNQGIVCDHFVCKEPIADGVKEFLKDTDLLVLDSSATPELKKLVFQNINRNQTSVLYCPQPWEPVSRVLVVNQPGDYSVYFLKTIGCICREFRVTPFLLTIARSEVTAMINQSVAEDLLSCQGVPAKCGFYVGDHVSKFISYVAQLRHCSHVFIEQKNHASWLNGQKWNAMERIINLSNSCSLSSLVLPETTEKTILRTRYPLYRPLESTIWPRHMVPT